MKRIISALIGICVASQSLAYGVISAKVTHVRIDKDGKGMVFFDQKIGREPASCVDPSYSNALSFDTATPGGKSIMAMAIAAKTTGATVVAYGTGECSTYSAHVEDWSYGSIL